MAFSIESRKARWYTKDLIYSFNPWTPRALPPAVAALETLPTWRKYHVQIYELTFYLIYILTASL